MKVGSLVECIANTSSFDCDRNESVPKKGGIYTVRGIHPDGDAIRLEEIVNRPIKYADEFGECYFLSSKFRELQPPMNVSELIEELLNEPQPC